MGKLIEKLKKIHRLKVMWGWKFVIKFIITYVFFPSEKYFELEKEKMKEDYTELLSQCAKKQLEKRKAERIIWFFWWQGIKSAPILIRECYFRIKEKSSYKIVIIDKDNYHKYIIIPTHVIQKFNNGCFNITHLSDIIRFALLYKYGGLWVDSTCFFTDKLENYEYVDSIFYSQKMVCNKDIKYNPSFGRWATYIMGSNIKENILFKYIYDMLILYWEKYDFLIEYFLIDYYLAIIYDSFDFAKQMIDGVPVNNTDVFYVQENFDYTKKLSHDGFFFKLSYKKKIDIEKLKLIYK